MRYVYLCAFLIGCGASAETIDDSCEPDPLKGRPTLENGAHCCADDDCASAWCDEGVCTPAVTP